jgi:hypothetical protein
MSPGKGIVLLSYNLFDKLIVLTEKEINRPITPTTKSQTVSFKKKVDKIKQATDLITKVRKN